MSQISEVSAVSEPAEKQNPFSIIPVASDFSRPVQLVTNFHKLCIPKSSNMPSLFKYSLQITPEVAEKSKIIGTIIKEAKPLIQEKMAFFLAYRSNIYSYEMSSDKETYEVVVDGQKYTLEITFSKAIQPGEQDEYAFYSVFFKCMMRNMSFEQVGRNCYNPKEAKKVGNLEIWPGFYSIVSQVSEGVMIQIDLTSKVCRKDKVLETLKDFINRKRFDQERINEEVKGMVVITSYSRTGRHTYRVESVDFQKNPTDEFEKKDGTMISFKNYYLQQYDLQILENNQPLLVCKDRKTNKEIYLIPELCEMTGLTESHRADFRLMKDVSFQINRSAQDKHHEVQKLIKEMENMEKVKKILNKWKMSIQAKPLECQGQNIQANEIMMAASGKPFKADCNANEFDRNIQNKMVDQIPLKKWCIIHTPRSGREVQQFSHTIKQCLDQFNYPAAQPKTISLSQRDREDDWQSWQKVIRENVQPGVDFVVFVLPGPKGKGKCYSDIKKQFLSKTPVPNQVILQSTISRGKNLRSIVTKILIQMNSKLGGVPWSITKMPFTQKRTMVIGISFFKKRGQANILALVASINTTLNKFFSRAEQEKGEVGTKLESMFTDAFNSFKSENDGNFPERVIIYREGLSPGQKNMIKEQEIPQIKQAMKRLNLNDTGMIYCMINCRIKTKFTQNDGGRIQNPRVGTVLDHTITKRDTYEFYLVSTTCRQGTPTPTHYSVIYDDIQLGPESIQALSYKLSYLYFNYSGPVKIPAPIKYAYRLAQLVGESGNTMPHKHWDLVNGLYYV